MKGIILDFDGNYALVLTQKGDFKRIYNNFPDLQIGDEVDTSRTMSPLARIFSQARGWGTVAAACLIFFLTVGYGIADYFKPVTFVTLDINPSVEISLNRYSRVLDVSAINSDGAILVRDGDNYKNKKIEEIVDLLLERAICENYLSTPDSAIMFAVSNIKDEVTPEMEKRLLEAAESGLEKREGVAWAQGTPADPEKTVQNTEKPASKKASPTVKVLVENTTIEKHKEAQSMNMSQGKLLIYEKLKEYNPNVKVEDVKQGSVSKILRELHELDINITDQGVPEAKDRRKEVKTLQKSIKKEIKDLEKALKEHKKEVDKKQQEELKGAEKLPEKIFRDSKIVTNGSKEKHDDEKRALKALKEEIKARQKEAKKAAQQELKQKWQNNSPKKTDIRRDKKSK